VTVVEIVDAFGAAKRDFPVKAVEAAIAQREEVTPALLQIIEHATAPPAEWARDSRVFSTVFALFLLGQFREQAAYRPIVRLAQCAPRHADEIIGDFITYGLSNCLASVFDGDCEPIHELIKNPNAEEFARAAGVSALKNLVLADVLDRTSVFEYYRHLLTDGLEREYSFLWTEMVCVALDLYPEGLVPELEKAFEDDLIDPMDVSPAEIAETLKRGREMTLARTLRNFHPYIDDTIEEFGCWICWHEGIRFDNKSNETLHAGDRWKRNPYPSRIPSGSNPGLVGTSPAPAARSTRSVACEHNQPLRSMLSNV